jgi:hypothetical protein
MNSRKQTGIVSVTGESKSTQLPPGAFIVAKWSPLHKKAERQPESFTCCLSYSTGSAQPPKYPPPNSVRVKFSISKLIKKSNSPEREVHFLNKPTHSRYNKYI